MSERFLFYLFFLLDLFVPLRKFVEDLFQILSSFSERVFGVGRNDRKGLFAHDFILFEGDKASRKSSRADTRMLLNDFPKTLFAVGKAVKNPERPLAPDNLHYFTYRTFCCICGCTCRLFCLCRRVHWFCKLFFHSLDTIYYLFFIFKW